MQRRGRMPESQAQALSARICDFILHWDVYRQAEKLYFYYPLGNEVSLLAVIRDALSENRQVAFPKVEGKDLEFYRIQTLEELSKGAFHVMEPAAAGRIPVRWEEALCFVPGVAFDRCGGRFGYGKGYYDRYFARHDCRKLAGCAYECQVTDRLPLDAWDRRMDVLVTENGILKTSHNHTIAEGKENQHV